MKFVRPMSNSLCLRQANIQEGRTMSHSPRFIKEATLTVSSAIRQISNKSEWKLTSISHADHGGFSIVSLKYISPVGFDQVFNLVFRFLFRP